MGTLPKMSPNGPSVLRLSEVRNAQASNLAGREGRTQARQEGSTPAKAGQVSDGSLATDTLAPQPGLRFHQGGMTWMLTCWPRAASHSKWSGWMKDRASESLMVRVCSSTRSPNKTRAGLRFQRRLIQVMPSRSVSLCTAWAHATVRG